MSAVLAQQRSTMNGRSGADAARSMINRKPLALITPRWRTESSAKFHIVLNPGNTTEQNARSRRL
ncbi:hypothetical protein [Bradyrhizobium sp. ORS 86]|uniref:hypothetical protein n=1 Tax=Bradyrhizobium sp. ORS 86 TaxID=1685970 RepID=UPI00388F33E0